MDEIPETISFAEAAKLINVSSSTISQYVKKGRIPEDAVVTYPSDGKRPHRKIIKSKLIETFSSWIPSVECTESMDCTESATSETQ